MSSEALNSAISGLQADSTWLDVIGNNIANVNTVGYKSGSVSFANQFNQALSSGAGDSAASGFGGVDPQQVGSGTRVQSIQTNFADGVVQQTGVSTDIAIQGNGFLISKSGSNTYLTRAGNLTFDSNGYLVDANGGFVQGYNATLTYSKTTINSFSSVGAWPFPPGTVPAQITQASYQLNTSDTAQIQNIQINPNMTMPPKATTQINFTGNLDAYQQATTNGGILDLNPNGKPILPLATSIDQALLVPFNPLNPAAFNVQGIGGPATATTPYALQQVGNAAANAPMVLFGINLGQVQASAGNYAWELQPPVPPALQTQETIYDSNGGPHQVTIQFYQVNDLGAGGINSANGPSQAAYAWYAFDTTGGQAVSTNNLLGGTGMLEGNFAPLSYDEGTLGQIEIGDLIYFNTDGSLADPGACAAIPVGNLFGLAPTPAIPQAPHIYIPEDNNLPPTSPLPSQGAEIMQVALNFGTAGVLGVGQRNGLTGDADGSYQVINGTNTYVPDSYATLTQDGYPDGTLQNLSFDNTGTIVGSFTNGQNLDLAKVAMATINNQDGLSNVGNGYYQASASSGASQMGLAGQNGMGTIQGGALEGSNVDLSTELTNMIIAQKGFDTNARMITTVSQDLQTIAQLGE